MGVVLLPLIKGPPSFSTLKKAMQTAGDGGEVIIIRIIPEDPFEKFAPDTDRKKDVDVRKKAEMERGKKDVEETRRRAMEILQDRDAPGCRISTLVRTGNPREVISKIAGSVNPGFIVMDEEDADTEIPYSPGKLRDLVGRDTGIPILIVSRKRWEGEGR